MLRLYAGVAAAALLATGVAGISKLWGFDPLTGFYHVGVGVLFAYAGFSRSDSETVRQIVGGLGVLLLVVKVVEIVVFRLALRHFLYGPLEITCLVVGVTSILAARARYELG